ncbi:MAG: hypothetical protein Q4E44_03310 [bacterium]|nr:hypothetical protein [bacterium]
MIIAVDFDGTIVEHEYPKIGKEKIFATETLRQLINDGHRLILWTVREGDLLDEAVEWCRQRGVEFYAINKDFPEENTSKNQNYSRKIKADVWIDDLNVGGLPDWGTIYQIITEKKTLQQVMEEKLTRQLPKPQKKRWWQI